MKPKISFICCLLAILVMALPMSVPADGDGEMVIQAYTDDVIYYSPPVTAGGTYRVTEPLNFEHAYCDIYVRFGKVGQYPQWAYWGRWTVGTGGTGDVDAWCGGDGGSLAYEWDYSEASPSIPSSGDYYLEVRVDAYDDSDPQLHVYEIEYCNEFEIVL